MRKMVFLLLLLSIAVLHADVGTGLSVLFPMDNVFPVLVWVIPIGGETWLANQIVPLDWTTIETHPGTLAIDWSADNGTAWQTVQDNLTDTGAYTWLVPTANTQQAKLRLTVTDTFGNVMQCISELFILLPGSKTAYSVLLTLDNVLPTLALTTPNGGENWFIGNSHDITWTASDSHLSVEPIWLEWSANNGGAWSDVAHQTQNDGTYPWTIPAQQTTIARVRVSVADMFGNSVSDLSSATFRISYAPLQSPGNLDVDIANEVDAVITWQPVTQTIYGTPIVPDGYIVLYNETVGTTDEDYYFLGATAGTTLTHHRVAEFRLRMFYRVVAYKDYDGRLTETLARLAKPTRNHSYTRVPTWGEIKNHVGIANLDTNKE
jgi:hypothetical protein